MVQGDTNPRIERVHYELRAEGIEPEQANPLRSGIHTRGYLPHVKREGASYFVTFRLEDSLPKEVLFKIQAERAAALTRFHAQCAAAEKTGTAGPGTTTITEIERNYFRKIETFLDRGHGNCWLRQTRLAQLVVDAIRYFEGDRYLLHAWMVMPNHVHVVVWPAPNFTLTQIVQSWKRFTSREANKQLGCTGNPFWQRESYDHWIRNDDERARCCRYVIHNPVKARLCVSPEQWPWSSAWKNA